MDCLNSLSNYFTKSDYPELGCKHNVLEGTGQYLSLGANYSVSILKNGDRLIDKVYAIAVFILCLPLTLIGTICREVGRILPHNPTGHTEAVLGKTDPNRVEQMYDLLEKFHEACEAVGLKYVIMSGSVLGEQRHGGIIPWDDDIDIGFFSKDKEKFLNELAPILKGLNIELTFHSWVNMYQFNFTKEHRQSHYPMNDEIGVLELCPLKVEDGRVLYESDFERMQSPNDWFNESDILEDGDLKTEIRPFGPNQGLSLRFPPQDNVEKYLKRYYGEKCLEEAVSSHLHVRIPFTQINMYMPVFRKEKVPVVEKACAQGCNRWVGPSKTQV